MSITPCLRKTSRKGASVCVKCAAWERGLELTVETASMCSNVRERNAINALDHVNVNGAHALECTHAGVVVHLECRIPADQRDAVGEGSCAQGGAGGKVGGGDTIRHAANQQTRSAQAIQQEALRSSRSAARIWRHKYEGGLSSLVSVPRK
eukprot:6211239-Pleurochrysis_carterae.AAC.2